MRVFFIRCSFFVSQRLVSNFFHHFYMYFIKMCLSMSDFLYGANVLCFSGRCQLSFLAFLHLFHKNVLEYEVCMCSIVTSFT